MWILFIAAALALQFYDNALLFYRGSSANWWWPFDVLDWFRYLGVMGFAAASVLSLRRSRWAKEFGIGAAACGLYWFIKMQIYLPVGSWQHWNDIAPGEHAWQVTLPMFAVLFTTAALTGSLLGKVRFALPAGFVALLGWYLTCAHPYDVATIGHPDDYLRILQFEKRGLHIRETLVYASQRRFPWVRTSERSLFQFRWKATWTETAQLQDERPLLDSLRDLEPLAAEPAIPLEWNVERWYVYANNHLYVLPPEAIAKARDYLREASGLRVKQQQTGELRDICLGFCFAPMVGLGFPLRAERARLLGQVWQQ